MSSISILVLVTLLGLLSVTQSRPRERTHQGLYDDLKPVPFVDNPEEYGYMYGVYSEKQGKKDKAASGHGQDDKLQQYYDRYNKEHNRNIAGEDDIGNESDIDNKKSEANTKILDENEPDLTQLPVEGGVEEQRTKSKLTKSKSKSKPKRKEEEKSLAKNDEPKKPKEVKDKKNKKVKKDKINHRHSKHGKKRKGDKKSKKKSGKKQEKEQSTTTSKPELDESFLGSVDQEPGHFNMKDFIKEHPDFKENVGTIVAQSDDKETTTQEATTTTMAVTTTLADDSADDDGDHDDADDADIDDDSDDDELVGADSDSHDKSSEEYEFYDYYDEEGDSSYSSSEVAAEQGIYGTPYDWFKQYEKMFGDQPMADSPGLDDNKAENTSDKTKYETKTAKTEPIVKSVEKTTTAVFIENKDKIDEPDNIPKTAIEPSTSPNPPTPQKDVKSTVTQPAIPQWKQKLNSWNYIESRPVEVCKSDMDCTAGRMCKFGLCLCGQPDFCDGHSKPVCGSDGQQYPSHCELHRSACILGFHIRIDHENNCFKDKQGNVDVDKYEIDNSKDDTKDTKIAEIPDPVLPDDIPKSVVKKGGESDNISQDEADNDQDSKELEKDNDQVNEVKPLDDKVNDVLDLSEVSKDVVIGGGMVEKTVDNMINQDINNVADSFDSDDGDYDDSQDDDDADDDDLDDDSAEELYHGDVVTTPFTPESDESDETEESDNQQADNKISFGEGSIKKAESESIEGDNLIPLFCTPDVYMKFKADVLEYHCIYFGLQNCDKQTQEEKQKLAAMMFNYFDDNYNGTIEKEELWEMQLRERIDEISSLCTLLDIATFDELGERDGKLSTDEFIQAFDIPDLLEHKLEIVPLLTTVGNGLEVKCDVTTSSDVVWKRNDVDLSLLDFPGISVLSDGSLYIESIGVDHVSNLTCYDRKKPSVKQMHMLTIQKPPHVIVSPETLDTIEGKNVLLHCHAEGYPISTIEWQFEDKSIQRGAKYYIRDYDNSLTVMHVEYMKDTGSYKCIARNNAGVGEASIHMTVHKNNQTQYDNGIPAAEESFVVFHDDGYTMHEPSLCLTQRHVAPSFGNFYYIPDELDAPPALCESGVPCVWGSAINVKNTFIYATQPRENRIVVIDIKRSYNPNQVIFTDHIPVSLNYIDHLDEVWVVCWNGESDNGSKTIVIIRNASQKMQHHAIHTQPIGNRFDLVQDLFLPPDSELHHPFKFGYTVHNEQQGLFKIELVTKKYLKAVDLTKYACVPHSVAFEPLGGNVLVQCIQKSAEGETNMILNLDYITDTVKQNFTMPGIPLVSPDSENVVIVDQEGGRISIFKVTNQGGIERQFEVTVDTSVDSATFRKAQFGPGYDLYMVSADSPAIFSVSLTSGKVDTISDVGESDPALYLPWAKKTRPLISGDIFSDYLTTASESSMVILDGHHHRVNCNFDNLHNPTVLAYSRIAK